MKDIKTIITWFKEDPKDAIQTFLSIIATFTIGYCLIWLGAILDGNC